MARVELLITVDKQVADTDLLNPYTTPANGASVLVKLRDGTPATVWADETSGITVSNPLVTDSAGRVEGWVEEGSYTIQISGSGLSTYNQPYEALRGDALVTINGSRLADNTVPGSKLINGAVSNAKLGAGAVTAGKLDPAVLPLGTILDWWVPNGASRTPPTGWVVAQGQTLGAGQHDFAGGGNITMPNLISRFTIGASPTAGYANTHNPFDGSPAGVGGVGGSNSRNLTHNHSMPHTHGMPQHAHSVQDHKHGMFHTHDYTIPDHTHGLPLTKTGWASGSNVGTTLTGGSTFGPSARSAQTGGSRSETDFGNATTDAGGGGQTESTNTPTANALSNTDTTPAYVGVLKIIKVRNTL